MKPKNILTGPYIIALLVAIIGAHTEPAAAEGTPRDCGHTFYYNFENTLEPWQPAADSGMNYSLTRISGDNGCAGKGRWYAQLSSTFGEPATRPDILQPVATWIWASFPAPSGQIEVRVDWRAKNTSECIGCIPAVYAGTSLASAGGQFQMIGPQLGTNWQPYHYETSLPVGDTHTVYLAVGWMGGGASIGMDCIKVTIRAH